jgi:FkbM family methyltransferase
MLDCTRAQGLTFWFPAGDEVVGRSLRDAGEFARIEVELFARALAGTAPGTILDIGANIGAVGLPIAARLPAQQVVCFEPNLSILQLLCTNITVNGLENASARPWAVGAAGQLVQFPHPDLAAVGNFGSLGLDSAARRHAPTLMLPIDELALTDVRGIKIDLQGHDLEALKGAAKTIARDRPLVLFEALPAPANAEAIALMSGMGYRCHWLFAPFVLPGNAKGLAVSDTSLSGDANVVATPPGMTPPWPLPAIARPDEDWRSRMEELGATFQIG